MACRRAADHEGVYEPNRSKAALTSGHRWNEYKSIRIRLRFRQASGNQNPQCPSRPGPFVSKRLTSMILPPFRTARTIRFEQGELPDRVARVLQRAVQQADPLPPYPWFRARAAAGRWPRSLGCGTCNHHSRSTPSCRFSSLWIIAGRSDRPVDGLPSVLQPYPVVVADTVFRREQQVPDTLGWLVAV